MSENTFRKFWVVSVNGWLCDASYSGEKLKEKHPAPSFRKFWFIRSMDELAGFNLHKDKVSGKELSNEELVAKWLLADEGKEAPEDKPASTPAQPAEKTTADYIKEMTDAQAFTADYLLGIFRELTGNSQPDYTIKPVISHMYRLVVHNGSTIYSFLLGEKGELKRANKSAADGEISELSFFYSK